MKKLLLLTPVLMLNACLLGGGQSGVELSNCKMVDATQTHLIYKCPSDKSWIQTAKNQQPNVKFTEMGALKADKINADTQNTYVEMVMGMSGGCPKNFHYRVMVKPIDKDNAYAVIVCK